MTAPLAGRVALVAGATRGAGRGVAVALGEAGATVYCTGRSTRTRGSEYDRPETIEETAALVDAAGGTGVAVAVDHLVPDEVAALVARIDAERGRLDVLVNDVWGGELLMEWNTPVWEHDLDRGLRLLRLAVDTHLITSHCALALLIRNPGGLLVEMTDGTREYNDDNYRVSTFYDLAKASVLRLAFAQAHELAPHGATAVALTPGWLRSEMMLDNFGVTEETWRDAANPHFAAISESPRFVRRGPRRAPPQRRLVLLRRPRARVRVHRRRRLPARLLALHGRGPRPGPPAGPDRLPLAPAASNPALSGAIRPFRRGAGACGLSARPPPPARSRRRAPRGPA
jgi:NAD(P)-dependent dehydrogenase (short-subunit alcohol dehydrogenase family)